MNSKARSLFARKKRAVQTVDTSRFDGRVEELEPRILFSADAAALLLDPTAMPAADLHGAIQQVLPPATADQQQTPDARVAQASATTTSTELVFIDARVPNAQELMQQILAQQDGQHTLEIHWLGADRDGVAQITDILQGRRDISALHLISHGADGAIQIGSTALNAASLPGYADQVSAWGQALIADADLLIYGCDVAQTAIGQHFVDDLGMLTGADVAASTDTTGHRDLGGDWDLEFQDGHIDSAVVVAPSLQAQWTSTLSVSSAGSETRTNTTTSNTQQTTILSGSQIASDANGNYVVVWEDTITDFVYARKYNADGSAATAEFQVNTDMTGALNKDQPTVAMDSSGNFVIAWRSQDQDGNLYGVYAQRYNASAVAQGSEFRVNTTTSNTQERPAIAMNSNGFVITWTSHSQDGSLDGIYAQRYDASGVAQGSEFLVNTTTSNDQQGSDIGMDASGNFVIAWTSYGQDGSVDGVYAKRYNASGVAQGSEFRINTTTANNQTLSSVSMNASGTFVVAWTSTSQDGSLDGAYARTYDSTGTALSAEIQLNSTTASYQRYPSVAINGNGDFLATWQSNSQDGSVYGVYMRQFSSTGTALTSEALVNTTTSNDQIAPSITWSGTHVVISWSGNGTGDSDGVFFQRYTVNTPPVITSNSGGASASINVAENTSAVTTVTASDGEGQTLTYSISGGADAASFTIDSNTGVLTFTTAPNYEVPTDSGGNNVYDLIVQVSDGIATDTQTLAVTVTAVNEAPIITSDGGGASATKNVAENGTAVTTVAATDMDTGTTLTYSITGGADAAKFSINSSTGVLTFVSAPDYESAADAGGNNVYDVTVQVSDGTNTDTQALAVTVTDVSDNAPVITSDGGGASATKNVAENGTAVTTVTATDVDTGTTLTYSITGGADAAKFSINSSTGVLTFVSAPDYESPTDASSNNVYDVTVQVSDGTNTDTQAIAITVTDVNDNAPIITSDGGGASATKNVAENGTAVTTVTATDVDAGTTLTYSITGGADAAKFSINSSTGVLTFVSAPDYEAPTDAGGNNVYDVTVRVSDGTNADTQALAVTVSGVNESPSAQIAQGNYNATEKVGLTLQGTGIQIADPDAMGGTVQAQLSVGQGVLNVSAGNAGVSITGSGSSTVSITGTLAQINQLLSGSSTGTISYVNSHDVPLPTDTLTLTVNDQGNTGSGTALSDSTSATINVTAVNDSPAMSAITLTANAAPSTSWSSSTLLNGSSDPDGDTLTVRVLQGPQHGTLSISGSGQVTYTTNTGYVGSDSFSYVAFDGQANSSDMRVMSIQASSPLVEMGPVINTSNTDSPPTKVDTTTKNDGETSTPKPGKAAEPKPVLEDLIVVAPQSKADITESTEPGSVGALLHHLTNSTWTPGRVSDAFETARQIFFAPPAGTYVTSTVANAPSVMQLLDLIKPNLEHAPDINLSLTPLSSVTHALPAGRLADADAADNDSGRAPVRLTKIATYSSGLGLSIGTIWWTARMSGLVTSALISTPAWRSLDPLPVVTAPSDDPDHDEDDDSRLGDREVEHLFDGDKPIEQDMPIIQ